MVLSAEGRCGRTFQHSEVQGYAVELQAAANASQPHKGKLRTLVNALITGLTNAATPLATGIATGLGSDAIVR